MFTVTCISCIRGMMIYLLIYLLSHALIDFKLHIILVYPKLYNTGEHRFPQFTWASWQLSFHQLDTVKKNCS